MQDMQKVCAKEQECASVLSSCALLEWAACRNTEQVHNRLFEMPFVEEPCEEGHVVGAEIKRPAS